MLTLKSPKKSAFKRDLIIHPIGILLHLFYQIAFYVRNLYFI